MNVLFEKLGNTLVKLVRDGLTLRLGNAAWAQNNDELVPLGQLRSLIADVQIEPLLDVFVLQHAFTAAQPYKTTNGPDYDQVFPFGTTRVYQALVDIKRGTNQEQLTVEVTGNSVVWGSSLLRTLTFSPGEGMGNHYNLAVTNAFTTTTLTYSLKDASGNLLDVKTITLSGSGGGSGSGSGSGSGGSGTYEITGGSSTMSFAPSGGVQNPPDTYSVLLTSLSGLIINGTSGLSIQGGIWSITHTSGNAYSMVLVSGSATISGVIPITAATLSIVSLSSAYPAEITSGEAFAVSGNITV